MQDPELVWGTVYGRIYRKPSKADPSEANVNPVKGHAFKKKT